MKSVTPSTSAAAAVKHFLFTTSPADGSFICLLVSLLGICLECKENNVYSIVKCLCTAHYTVQYIVKCSVHCTVKYDVQFTEGKIGYVPQE